MATSETSSDNWQSNKGALECNAHMFDNSIATDVTFVVSNSNIKSGTEGEQLREKNKTIQAHKYILVSRSPVFYTMFYGEMPETKSEIVIDDVDPDAFYKALRYMYTDEIQLEPELVMFILYIAKKYMIQTLANKCTSFLEKQLRPENAVTICDQSLFFEEKDLAAKCMRMIRRSSSQALQSSSMVEIRQSSLDLILDDPNLNVPEVAVFNACQRWATRRCEEEEIEVCGPNLRRILGESLNKIRFPVIPLENFNATVSTSEILPPTDELKIFRYISAGSTKNQQDIPYPFEDRFKPGQSRNMWRNVSDQETEEIQGQSFTLEVEAENEINIQGLYICDLDVQNTNNNPQQQDNLAISVTVDGSQLLQSCVNKEDVAENKHVKIIRLNTWLTGQKQAFTIDYARPGKCPNCSYNTLSNRRCQNCGRTECLNFISYRCNCCNNPWRCPNCRYQFRNPPQSSDIKLPVLKKQDVEITDELVSLKIKNTQASQIPFLGIIYTL